MSEITPETSFDPDLQNIRLCPDCDLIIAEPFLTSKQEACCPRCHHLLERHKPHNMQNILALVLTGLLLYIPANIYPVLYMELLGNELGSTIWNGIVALQENNLGVVAALVFLAAMVVPLVRLLLLLPVLSAAVWKKGLFPARRLYRWYVHMGEWGMVEIYLLGVLVSVIKLADMATVHLGIGLYSFAALMLVEIGISLNLNQYQLWRQLEDHS